MVELITGSESYSGKHNAQVVGSSPAEPILFHPLELIFVERK